MSIASVSTCFELSGAMPLSVSFGIRCSARAEGLAPVAETKDASNEGGGEQTGTFHQTDLIHF